MVNILAAGHRDYGMTGFHIFNHDLGNHQLEYGYRRHKDYRARAIVLSQRYTLDDNTMTLLSEHGNDQTGDDAELKDTDAESFYLKDTIQQVNSHTLGVRYEDTEKNDGTNANPVTQNKMLVIAQLS